MRFTYDLTVTVNVEFTEAEKEIIEYARTFPLGVYQKEKYTTSNVFTLGDIKSIALNVATVTGHTDAENENVFEISDDEPSEDVPGGGELALPAEKLHNQLQEILTKWGTK